MKIRGKIPLLLWRINMSFTNTIPITKDGYEKLQTELKDLKSVQRPKVIQEIAGARAHGDLKENAEYHAAREKQGFIEARITELESSLSRTQIIELPKGDIESVRFGALVTLSDEETSTEQKFRIVGDLEADISKKLISVSSPIAKAIMGKKIDDLVLIKAPSGTKEYVVPEIEF